MNASACAICPRKYRPIGGDGPQPARILVVGERPGATEHKLGKVFVGKTGEELNETYLPLAGLARTDVRVCNAVRCWADANRTPTDREVEECARHHLPGELNHTQPEIVILMGGSACKLLPSIRLDTHHGFPQQATLMGWRVTVVPMYHPALGLHESRWMTQLLEDWEELPARLTGAGFDPPPSTDYRILQGVEVNDIELKGAVAIDTESHGNQPFSVQFSPGPGRAYMVLADDEVGLATLSRQVSRCEGILHNAVHDLGELQRMGIILPAVRDTMQEAYHLGNLPQGLKPLVYRLFGFTMTSWEDVVRPASIEALLVWMHDALEIARADLSLIEVKRLKTKVRETVKKGPLERLLIRVLIHAASSEYDPWLRLQEFWAEEANEWMTSHVEARLGPYPILGIGNAPLDRATQYACGDADWTGQLAHRLCELRRTPYWRVAEVDQDL